MEAINVNWGVNVESGYERIPLEDLECETIEEWEALSMDEQQDRLQTAIDELPERVCIIVTSWDH